MTNERKRLNHFKNNKENTDYITVLDRSLNKETIKPAKEIDIDGKSLNDHIQAQNKIIINLVKKNTELNNKYNELKETLDQIVRGLNSRWKRY